MATIRVSPMAEGDIPGSVAAIQAAFAEDPYTHWMFDMSKYNAQRNAASLGVRCRWGMRNGLFHVAKEQGSDEVLGVAMWLKPQPANQPATWYDWFEDWRLWFNQLGMNLYYGRGGLNVKRYYIWKQAQETAHSSVWTDPRGYYFLNIMVVSPKAQGKGIGRAMMKYVTDRADLEGMPCYLESSRDVPNMEIYGRFGFRFAKELLCDDDGTAIKLYTMVRDPDGPSTT
ncbi:acyl-CoA N-acyltransferase [Microdochium trichocladiopsis]|uniref:Acyl-CoA N-acyltransferase n=1 Tax=Microdochium trichocladiopsis TaxID=1682393 RepID=A0A9P8YH84_9PEZI|nr:acyl-CoA N-acyltransferase [Microdochium trichocladiopsis]KAH7037914.1 acyl-CoA N-acyltransferase [Microdochium trichocladiopsis]